MQEVINLGDVVAETRVQLASPEIMELESFITRHTERCVSCTPDKLCDLGWALVSFTGREWGHVEVAIVA